MDELEKSPCCVHTGEIMVDLIMWAIILFHNIDYTVERGLSAGLLVLYGDDCSDAPDSPGSTVYYIHTYTCNKDKLY